MIHFNLELNVKERVYHQFARIGKCLSSDKRLEIMDLLSNGPKNVEEIALRTGMNIANVSRHLQVLLDAKLVKFHKKGNYVIYSISDPSVIRFLIAMNSVCENRLSDVQQIKEELKSQYKSVQSIGKQELQEKMKQGKLIVIDFRPADEYETKHIPNAVSVSFERLDEYLQTISHDTEIAAFCRGMFCSLTFEAVEFMQKKGFKAYRIEENIQEYEAF
ncbi:ArsR/SmtB family transcription factor [Paenibacillus polymyxa]|uniref:ArsR/SmtB family transcription factor n=1 Tax=Paenibacillus polymyxa TaxID=1406 RepID=UPI0023F63549|nr:metalloregulator ArsR/SmtB family transcription factor [Paenibacillus polymyxa]